MVIAWPSWTNEADDVIRFAKEPNMRQYANNEWGHLVRHLAISATHIDKRSASGRNFARDKQMDVVFINTTDWGFFLLETICIWKLGILENFSFQIKDNMLLFFSRHKQITKLFSSYRNVFKMAPQSTDQTGHSGIALKTAPTRPSHVSLLRWSRRSIHSFPDAKRRKSRITDFPVLFCFPSWNGDPTCGHVRRAALPVGVDVCQKGQGQETGLGQKRYSRLHRRRPGTPPRSVGCKRGRFHLMSCERLVGSSQVGGDRFSTETLTQSNWFF